MPGDTLKFIDYRKPRLEAGNYVFKVIQSYGDPAKQGSQESAEQSIRFKVAGERLRIEPQDIFAKYPPVGEQGDFAGTLPHISLYKASLPWERSAYVEGSAGKENFEPWLYLMLINDDDINCGDAKRPENRNLDDLPKNAFFPDALHQSLQQDITDKIITETEKNITTVDIKAGFFKQLIADHKEDLEYLAHVRQRYNEQSELVRELSVIIANRFAKGSSADNATGMANYALLVSLESYLNKDTHYMMGSGKNVRLNAMDDNAYVRFIVLTQWSFTGKDRKINFEERSKALDVDSLRLPVNKRKVAETSAFKFKDRLDAGMSALLHDLRLGDNTISWYRGPCIPYSHSTELSEKELAVEQDADGNLSYVATDADKLLYYYKEDGMLDISYAAAYELGRFLGLRNPDYAKALHQYKRDHMRYITLRERDTDRGKDTIAKGITIEHLPYAKLEPQKQEDRLSIIKDFLKQLALLKAIPSWYLVPDPDLLPECTLRIFQLDKKWIASLWLGALSLGGRAAVTHSIYQELYKKLENDIPGAGLFLHSDLVWAYPELMVACRNIPANSGTHLNLSKLKADREDNYTDYIESHLPLSLVRQEELAPDLLFVLTQNPFNYVSLTLPPEALHYGADLANTAYTKDIKYKGNTAGKLSIEVNNKNTVNIKNLAAGIQKTLKNSHHVDDAYKSNLTDFGSARFSRYMLEGEPKVEFSLGGNS